MNPSMLASDFACPVQALIFLIGLQILILLGTNVNLDETECYAQESY